MKFKKPKKNFFIKEKRFDPRSLWVIFCVVFVGLLIVDLAVSSWYFVRTTNKLDAPVLATLETNAQDIKIMKKNLDKVEMAIKERSGLDLMSSQIVPVVVE